MRNNLERLSGIESNQDQVVVQAPLSFVIPTEFVDLPSKGKLYPVGHPLRDKTSIEIKQMTAKEEDILTSENYIKKGVTIEKLLESIIIDKNIKSESITTIDRSAILIAARISAYGPEYKVSVKCSKCSTIKNINYDLTTEPKIIEPKEQFNFTENGTFTIELPNTKWLLECRSMTGIDEIKNATEQKQDNLLIKQLESIVYSINKVTDRELIKQAIEVMPIKDSRYLRNKYKDSISVLKLSHSSECSSCKHSEEVEVPITLEFFWPKQ